MTSGKPGRGDRPAGWDSLNLGNNRGGPASEPEEVWPGQEAEPHEHFHDQPQETHHGDGQFGDDGSGHQYRDPNDAHDQHVATDTYAEPQYDHHGYGGYDSHGQDDDGLTERRPIPVMAKLILGLLVLIIVGLVALSVMSIKSPRRDDSNVDGARATVEPASPLREIGSDPMTDLAQPVTARMNMRRPQPTPPAQLGAADNTAGGAGLPDLRRFKPDEGDTLAANIQALRESQAATNTGLIERATSLEDKVDVLIYRNAALETDVQALKTLMEEKKSAVGKSSGQTTARVASASSGKQTAQRGTSARRAEAVIAEGKGRCVLNGATDGVFESDKRPRAWITGEAGQMEARAVGDAAPCVGQIRSIRAEDDTWVVVGNKGTLRLHTSREGR